MSSICSSENAVPYRRFNFNKPPWFFDKTCFHFLQNLNFDDVELNLKLIHELKNGQK